MGQMGAQQAPSMSQGPQQTAMPQGSMGLMGAPQPGAPMGAGAGFGAPPQGPQFNPASLQGKPMKKGGTVTASKRADGIAQRGKTKGRMC